MSYLADVVEVGGQGGNAFNYNGTENGSMLKRIQVWEGVWQIKAMKVWLTDGRSIVFGRPEENPKEFTFEDGEHFTSLSLWPNLDGKRLGALKFNTSHSREFYICLKNRNLNPEVTVDVASGICMGIKGRSGWDIDRFGFIFINTIKSAELTSVVYPTIHDVIPKVAFGVIKSMLYQNNSFETQEFTIETTNKITQISSWSVKGNLKSTVSLKVKAGIPFLAEGKSGYELSIGVEGTYDSETTIEKMELLSVPVIIPPGKTVDVRVTLGQATVDLPFTGIMKITCYNDRVLQYKTSGTYKGVAYTDGKMFVN
ncbi:aerolysin-like protein isoform X7 [Tachysurus fulvidraco]|nr:aerolysin-like protein isoform X7 [Tachysurus fulvidraco]XP_047656451.1 aerolysin-like protein isoform X7 [Tachysurus fulvidraco]